MSIRQKGAFFLSDVLHELDALHGAALYALSAAVAQRIVDAGHVVMERDGLLFAFPHALSAGDASGLALQAGVLAQLVVGAHNGRARFAVGRIEVDDPLRADILAGAAARALVLVDHGAAVDNMDRIKFT